MPRNVTVYFADGSRHEYQGAPDDASPEQIAARAGRDFQGKQIRHLERAPAAAAEATPEVTRNPFMGAVARGAELLGSGIETLGRAGEAIGDVIAEKAPILDTRLMVDREGIRLERRTEEDIRDKNQLQYMQNWADSFRNWGREINYEPSTKLGDLADNPLNAVPFIIERVIASSPDMVAAAAALPAYIPTRANEILNERLKNDGRTLSETTIGDVAAATSAAVVEGTLERFATRRLVKEGAEAATATRRIGKEAGVQAGTEAVEEVGAYAGETVGTQAGFDPRTAGMTALEAAIVGGGLGAGVQGAREVFGDREQAAPKAPPEEAPDTEEDLTPEQLAPKTGRAARPSPVRAKTLDELRGQLPAAPVVPEKARKEKAPVEPREPMVFERIKEPTPEALQEAAEFVAQFPEGSKNFNLFKAKSIAKKLGYENIPQKGVGRVDIEPLLRMAVTPRETIIPAEDKVVGQNAAGEQLYERQDGSQYRMRLDRADRPTGYPDFGGDLAPIEASPKITPPPVAAALPATSVDAAIPQFTAPVDFRHTILTSPSYDLEAVSPEDADFELEVLQQQAERGRLTPQNFAQSEIGVRLDTAQINIINAGLRTDPVGTVKSLREKLKPPAAPTETATLSPVTPAETIEAKAAVEADPAAAPVAPAEKVATPSGLTFTTAKGSTYAVNDDGTTTRSKAARPEQPGEEGLQPTSKRTVYVDKDGAERLSEIQTQGGARKTLRFDDATNSVAVGYLDGKSAGKVERRTVTKFATDPAIGLTPVEYWGDNKTVHFGNEITKVTPPEASSEPVSTRAGEAVAGATAGSPALPVQRGVPAGREAAESGVSGVESVGSVAERVDERKEDVSPALTAPPAAPPPTPPPRGPSGAAPTSPTPPTPPPRGSSGVAPTLPTPPRPTTPRQVRQAVQTALNSVTQSIVNRPNYTDSYGQKIIDWLGNLPLSKRKIQFALYTLSQMKQLLSTIMPGVSFLEKVNGRRAAQTSQELQHVAENQSKYRNIISRHSKAKWEKLKQVATLGTLYQVDPTSDVVKNLYNRVRGNRNAIAKLTPMEKMQYEIAEMYYSLPTDLRGILISDDGKSGIVPEYRKYRRQKFEAMVRNWIKQKMPLSDIARLRQEFNDPKNNLSFYIPLRRDQGVYLLEYVDVNNNVVSKRFGNPIERAAFKQRIEAQGVDKRTITESSRYSDIKGEDSGKPPVGFLGEIVAMLETAIPSTMTTAGGKVLVNQAKKDLIGEVYDIFLDYMPQNTLRQELSSRKVFDLGGGLKQFGVFGFNEDFLETYVKETPRIIYQLNNLRWVLPIENAVRKLDEQRKQYNDGRSNAAFMRDRLDMPPEQVNEAFDSIRKRVDFGYSPTYAPWVHAFTTSNYVLSIAANVSSGLINTTVIPLLAIPILAAKYGVAPTLSAIGRASAMFAKAPTEGGFKALGVRIGDWSIANGATGEYEQFFKKLVSRGVIGAASEQELMQAQRLGITGYESLGDKVNYLAGYVMKNSERFNREVTLLASFMLSREKGKNFTDAFEEAINDNSDVNGASLPASDSRLYQSGVGRVLLTFRKHILNAMILVAGTFKEALAKIEPLDQAASPAQKAQSIAKQKLLRTMARKRLLGIYAGAYMVSGIGGMPLFGAAEVLAAMLMGEDDEPYDLQEEVMEVLGELGLNGPVNALFNLDVASRTGFTDVLWRDDPQRLAEVGYITFGLEKLAGPTFSNAMNWQRGFGLIADGYTQRGVEALMPAAARNASKALRYVVEEGARTKNGVLIEDDINEWNMAMQVLGFAPADLATTQARTNAEFEITKKLRQRRTALLTQLYVGVSVGNGDAVRDARKSIAKFNRANPSIMIEFDTIERSFKERDRRNAESVDGLYIEKNLRQATIPYVSPRD